MKNTLRYFYRLDFRLRPVLTSLIARPFRPRNGKWKELVPETCCNRTILPVMTGDPASLGPGGTVVYELSGNSGSLAGYTQLFETDLTATLLALTGHLNNTYQSLALFSVSGNQVLAKPQKGRDATQWQSTQTFSSATPIAHAAQTDLPGGNSTP